jgi:hypothetical protein
MKLAKSALASATGTSNIFFFLHTNYFEDSAESSPLLHTWSLGVEEQFYLLMPSVLILLKNASPTRRNILLSILFALSLVLSIYWSGQNPPAGFYLLPSRAWELLVGTLAAMRVVPPISRRSYRETAAVLGLAAILLPGMFYDSSVPFPGIAALVPCLGAAVLIVSAESGPTFISRALSLRPVVFVGLISYSLYLWHWPLIVFQSFGRFLNTGISPTVDRVLILPVAVVAATLSWRFVELPFRRVSVPWPRSRRVVLAAGTVFLTALFSAVIWAQQGMPHRFSPESTRLAGYLDREPKDEYRTGECFLLRSDDMHAFSQERCLYEDPHKRTYLIIGDSHAAHLYPGIQRLYGERFNIIQATATGCMPVVGDGSARSTCEEMNRFVFGQYLKQHHVDLLIISARWTPEAIGPLLRTLKYVQALGIKVAVVGPTMEFDVRLPRLLALDGGPDPEVQRHVLQKYATLNREMRRVIAPEGALFIDVYSLLCPQTTCTLMVGRDPIFTDTGHLSSAGSDYLATRLRESGALPY